MENKKADNKILNFNNKIKALDEEIFSSQRNLAELDELEDIFVNINRNLSKCCKIVNDSIKNPKKNNIINEINNENRVNYLKFVYIIDDKRHNIKKEIENLKVEKEKYLQKIKQEFNKENDNKSEGDYNQDFKE